MPFVLVHAQLPIREDKPHAGRLDGGSGGQPTTTTVPGTYRCRAQLETKDLRSRQPRVTFPAFRQEVHTLSLRVLPGATSARTD
ncbi:MAG: hypothetical protein GX542_11030 [Rhodococcus sp.]|nr:hypothetical protein [Rhodococcus sp. (in: high G+C Gram-positive bacteria)]